jgi:hypothetical protein
MLTLLLFDIDGTVLLTGGAGVRGMTRAFEPIAVATGGYAAAELHESGAEAVFDTLSDTEACLRLVGGRPQGGDGVRGVG